MNEKPTLEDLMEAAIEAEVERAMAPYEGLMPPELDDEMRRLLRLALDTHPEAQRLLRAMLPAPDVDDSDKVDLRLFREVSPLNGAASGAPPSKGGRRG